MSKPLSSTLSTGASQGGQSSDHILQSEWSLSFRISSQPARSSNHIIDAVRIKDQILDTL